MYDWLPQEVALHTDVSDASWVVERLRPWGPTYPQPVACFMPDTYEAYARLLHPATEYLRNDGSVVGTWINWSTLAARRGVALGATTRWEEVSGFAPETGPAGGIDEPSLGSMPGTLVQLVADFLGPWTTAAEKTWFGMWEGNGTWWKGAHAASVGVPQDWQDRMDVRTFGAGPDRSAELLRIDDERDRVLHATPTFGTPERQYFLMSGPLAAASTLTDSAGGRSPNLWWPDDRAWLVSTEVDDLTTYVGGKASMIDALVASPKIEALPTALDNPGV
jgi:hypothetical protein